MTVRVVIAAVANKAAFLMVGVFTRFLSQYYDPTGNGSLARMQERQRQLV